MDFEINIKNEADFAEGAELLSELVEITRLQKYDGAEISRVLGHGFPQPLNPAVENSTRRKYDTAVTRFIA